MMILNEKLPEDYRIHLNNVYSVPDMWKYKTHINMAHLTMNVSSLPATEDANILKLFLTKVPLSTINACRCNIHQYFDDFEYNIPYINRTSGIGIFM